MLCLQAILFQNGRALGRLVAPQLQVTPIADGKPMGSQQQASSANEQQAAGSSDYGRRSVDVASALAAAGGRPDGDAEPADHGNDTLLEVHQLVFNRWQPVWTDFKHSQRSVVLHIPVNSTWRASNYRLQVVLSTSSVPHMSPACLRWLPCTSIRASG
jgi:hypothetical protein